MTPDRKEHLAQGLTAWLRRCCSEGQRPDASTWVDMQVAIGFMTEVEAHEFERWLGGVQ